jgi:hypothetical protein
LKLALEKARGADLVIASLYGRVRSGQARSVALPDSGTRALSTLIAAKTAILGISFGNPYLLLSFPELRTYMVAYGDMPSLQQAAARALMGEIDITGKLPISLPGMYPRGTGIQLKKIDLRASKIGVGFLGKTIYTNHTKLRSKLNAKNAKMIAKIAKTGSLRYFASSLSVLCV